MEPTQALYMLETALRLVVREVLGDGWRSAPGAPDQRQLERARTRDRGRRHGVIVSNDLLDFTETSHLTELIRCNWAAFEPVFQHQARTVGFLQVLDDERFSVAHSRDLVPFEQELLSGITGQLRQQIALWRNRDDPSTRFYPRIEEVKDNYGVPGRTTGYDDSQEVLRRLEVGEVLHFTGAAFGEQKRPVRWHLTTAGFDSIANPRPPEAVLAEGDHVGFDYTVTGDDVSENFTVDVYITTASRHRRAGLFLSHDDVRHFTYAVNPSEED